MPGGSGVGSAVGYGVRLPKPARHGDSRLDLRRAGILVVPQAFVAVAVPVLARTARIGTVRASVAPAPGAAGGGRPGRHAGGAAVATDHPRRSGCKGVMQGGGCVLSRPL